MPFETIVLIFALFGSAKVALDMVFMVARFVLSRNKERPELESAVAMLEGLSAVNEVLQRENNILKARLRQYEESQKKIV
ncbi:MAG TPA: hypothetical protein PLO17_19565 [Alcaligenes phenolicus]|uniref:hypothetical protein n=1 Tax=Alcaligenes phenolicus TaxID=232846 RepID=UPI002C38B162|nr:hypothetical protein [Alcaligenes phenolicus]HRO22589.1 hypothetical protein [Alcaligenes phenolicus]